MNKKELKEYQQDIEKAFAHCVRPELMERALTKAFSSKSQKLAPLTNGDPAGFLLMNLASKSIPFHFADKHPFLFYTSQWSLWDWSSVKRQIDDNLGFIAIDLVNHDLLFQTEAYFKEEYKCRFFHFKAPR